MTRVLLAGGGTAGHVNPLLATAAELRRREPDSDILVLGTSAGLEQRLVPEAGFELADIPKVPFPRRLSLDWVRFPGRYRAAIESAARAIERLQADVVVGFGGYVSTPAYRAARRAHVPTVVHEGNFRPGLANRLGARSAARVAITFPGTPLRGGRAGEPVLTGMPLRRPVADLDRAAERARARAALGLQGEGPVLLVTGGSQGAAHVNETMFEIAPDVLAAGAQVLHLAGAGKADAAATHLAGVAGAERYHVLEYLAQMELAYAAADLAVCRAGAATVCELAAVGLPAVFVPLPFGNGEQRLNCRAIVAAGGGLVRDNAEFTRDWARSAIVPLLADADRLADMGAKAEASGIRDGAERLVELALEVAR